MNTGGERIESRMDIEGDMIGYNVETNKNGTKQRLHRVETT